MRRMFKILFFIFLFVSIVFIINFFEKEKLKSDFESKLALRKELIEKIESKELKSDEMNRVILTKKYYGIAENNYVRVYACNDKEKVISFLYRSGFPDEEQYIFYSSDGRKLIIKYIGNSRYSYIDKIEENWYVVQYN